MAMQFRLIQNKEDINMVEWSKSNDAIGTVNRGNPAESGLCTLCRADCKVLST